MEGKASPQRKQADEFYETNLVEPIGADYVKRNKGQVLEKVAHMVASVGTSYGPIVLNIKLSKPNRVLFLYTDKTEEISDKVVKHRGMDSVSYEKSRVGETNPLGIYRGIKKNCPQWEKPGKMCIDFTGGQSNVSRGGHGLLNTIMRERRKSWDRQRKASRISAFGMNVFDWFPQNHAGHGVKDGQKIPLKTPNSCEQMAFVEYMEPMTPELKSAGYCEQVLSGPHRNNGESQGGKGRKAGKNKRWQQALRENLRLTLEELTIIIVAWISKRQKIGLKKGEDRNFCELRAKMGSESQRLCGIQNCSVEMEESRLRELLHLSKLQSRWLLPT